MCKITQKSIHSFQSAICSTVFKKKKEKCTTHNWQLFWISTRYFLTKNKIKIKNNKSTQNFPELRFCWRSIHHMVKYRISRLQNSLNLLLKREQCILYIFVIRCMTFWHFCYENAWHFAKAVSKCEAVKLC